MLFSHRVSKNDLVVKLNSFVLWMLHADISIIVEEDHEVRCNLVNVARVLCYN